MRHLTNFIYEQQNFLIKGHTKKQIKHYKLYKWFGENYFAHVETIEDIEDIMQNESNKELIESQKDSFKTLKEECGEESWFLMRPSAHPPYVYIYFEDSNEAKNNIQETKLTITYKDFNFTYWNKHNMGH